MTLIAMCYTSQTIVLTEMFLMRVLLHELFPQPCRKMQMLELKN